eukprot:133230_1
MKLQHHAWPSSHPIVEAYLTQIIIIDIFAYNSEETILLMKPFLLVLLVLITANLFLTAGDTADESKHAYGRRGKGKHNRKRKLKISQDSIAMSQREIKSNVNITDIPDNQLVIGNYFMLLKNCSTPEILHDIQLTRTRCMNVGNSQKRNFGDSDYDTGGGGHEVLYLDDCISESVYYFYQEVLFGMIEEKRSQIVEDDDDSSWENYDKLEARVVEYVVYSHNGSLGWHDDDDSNLTMVIMISEDEDYEGGMSEFRYDNSDRDDEIERQQLQWSDVLLFDSSVDHRILPVLNGDRHVVVIEFWDLGRSFRNGRTSIDVHEMDLECVYLGESMDCYKEDRDEDFEDYDNTNQQNICI